MATFATIKTEAVIVVVVEDDSELRVAAVDALIDAGFGVIETQDAEQALTILNSQASAIQVLFTDIHMPGPLDGLALAHHTRRTWPWIALLITSGTENSAQVELPQGSRYLPKPYRARHVTAQVRELAAMM